MMRSLVFILFFAFHVTYAQESVFGLLKDSQHAGDEFYEEGDFENALRSYKLVKPRKNANKELAYRMSRCYYFVRDYDNALRHYQKFKSEFSLPAEDLFYYSEINAFLGNYNDAVDGYTELLKTRPDDEVLLKKIWRLKNINFLYEDSLHYTIRPLTINTEYSELCPTPHGNGIVFISDRQKFDFKDAQGELSSFLNLYYAESRPDTLQSVSLSRFKKPQAFGKELLSGYHFGPISFYDNEAQCVFASTGKENAKDGSKKIQLYFAAKRDGKWKVSEGFQHNNKEFVLTNPSITSDGGTLYFSSDIPGGFGGSDLYRSRKIDGQWTKPENLGELINTRLDELFPYVSYQTLYFASDGHAGFGGLDIFSVEINEKINGEISNLGYPLNSSADDFGIVFNSKSHGYLSSNRKNGGYDDDLYEFETDFRTYPFEISGVVKIKENNLVDSAEITVLADAKIYLIDNVRQRAVSDSQTDANGNFKITIPWFSKYLLRVVTKDNQEHIASLEISKGSKEMSEYEIVVVKDLIQAVKTIDQK